MDVTNKGSPKINCDAWLKHYKVSSCLAWFAFNRDACSSDHVVPHNDTFILQVIQSTASTSEHQNAMFNKMYSVKGMRTLTECCTMHWLFSSCNTCHTTWPTIIWKTSFENVAKIVALWFNTSEIVFNLQYRQQQRWLIITTSNYVKADFLLVWAGISSNHRTPLIVIQGTLTAF